MVRHGVAMWCGSADGVELECGCRWDNPESGDRQGRCRWKVCLFAQPGTHLVADLNAYWVNSPPTGDLANQILARDPRTPSNIDLFTSIFVGGLDGLYPSGTAMAPAAGPVLTEAETRADLSSSLNRQFNNDTLQVTAALAVFDSAQVKAIVADPNLRAAVAGLNLETKRSAECFREWLLLGLKD